MSPASQTASPFSVFANSIGTYVFYIKVNLLGGQSSWLEGSGATPQKFEIEVNNCAADLAILVGATWTFTISHDVSTSMLGLNTDFSDFFSFQEATKCGATTCQLQQTDSVVCLPSLLTNPRLAVSAAGQISAVQNVIEGWA